MDFYRGRITYSEVIEMPLREFQSLYYRMYLDTLPADGDEDEENKNEKSSKQNDQAMRMFMEQLEDEL